MQKCIALVLLLALSVLFKSLSVSLWPVLRLMPCISYSPTPKIMNYPFKELMGLEAEIHWSSMHPVPFLYIIDTLSQCRCFISTFWLTCSSVVAFELKLDLYESLVRTSEGFSGSCSRIMIM